MAGSEAEERIREKVEASLRRAFPAARIIHELVIGSCRLDLAAVTPDEIVLAEIKSERDVLKRMAVQLDSAALVTRDVRLYVTDKHAEQVQAARKNMVWNGEGRMASNPDHIEVLEKVATFREGSSGISVLTTPTQIANSRAIHPRDVWHVLWSEEMRTALRSINVPCNRAAQREMTMLAVEHMSGRQIRRAVCAALRTRPFPRADKRMES